METKQEPKESTQKEELFILPMRNGNIFPEIVPVLFAVPFYPTYEEWKRPTFAINHHSFSFFLSYL